MLNRLPTPTECPSLSQILADIGNPTPKELAKSLGVSTSTVKGWIQADNAPRPVLLALFWMTRWGMSRVDAEATNTARVHAGMAMGLKHEISRLQRELAKVLTIAHFGAANDPLLDASVRPEARQQSLFG